MFYLALWVWNLVLLKLSPPFCYFSKQTLDFNSFLHAVTFSSTIIPVPFLHYFFLENRLNFFFSRWYILWHRSSWLHFLAIPSAPLFPLMSTWAGTQQNLTSTPSLCILNRLWWISNINFPSHSLYTEKGCYRINTAYHSIWSFFLHPL